MEMFIIGCVVGIVLLAGLIIYGAVSTQKKRKSTDTASYHILQGYDKELDEPYLYTPEDEGYLFGETKDTAQDTMLKQEMPIGSQVGVVNSDGESVVETVSRVKKHYMPSMDVSGTCMVYKIYFFNYEGAELPCSFKVIKNDNIDTITFTNQEVLLIKDSVTKMSYPYTKLKARYYSDFLVFLVDSESEKQERFHINPGSGNAFDNKVAPDKYYVENKDFEKAKHLVWKYIDNADYY